MQKRVTSGDKKLCNAYLKVCPIAKVSFSPHKIGKSHFKSILNFRNEIPCLSADICASWLAKTFISTIFVSETFHRKPKRMRLKLPYLYNINKAPNPNLSLNSNLNLPFVSFPQRSLRSSPHLTPTRLEAGSKTQSTKSIISNLYPRTQYMLCRNPL